MAFSWGAVVRPKGGQSVSGDTFLVETLSTGGLLVAVIDGLGGGEEARRAAMAAAEVVRARPESDLNELMRQSHLALHGTRGAVMALMTLDRATRRVAYVGVGNIGAQIYSREPIKPISKNGILGYRFPTLLKLSYSYNFGDTFVLYSDGISSRFGLESRLNLALPPQPFAESILEQYGKSNDDATVVVVRDTE
jgi:negative regulator of sigma-B (phosphoserine phosphatase)